MEPTYEHLATGNYPQEEMRTAESAPKEISAMNLHEVDHELAVIANQNLRGQSIDIARRDLLLGRKEELE